MVFDQIDNVLFIFDNENRFRRSPPIFINMAKRVSGFFFNQNISTAGAEMAKEDYKLRVGSVRRNFRGATCQARRMEMAQDRMAREKAPK